MFFFNGFQRPLQSKRFWHRATLAGGRWLPDARLPAVSGAGRSVGRPRMASKQSHQEESRRVQAWNINGDMIYIYNYIYSITSMYVYIYIFMYIFWYIYIYSYNVCVMGYIYIYMVPSSVSPPPPSPPPPHGLGPQVPPPPFLLFASYWQHFWGPASYLLGLCSISDYQPRIY